jgi:hypothetical protein
VSDGYSTHLDVRLLCELWGVKTDHHQWQFFLKRNDSGRFLTNTNRSSTDQK